MNFKRMGSLLLLAWPVIGFSELPQKSTTLENYSAENGFARPLPLTHAAQKSTLTKVTKSPAAKKQVDKSTAKKVTKKYTLVTKRQVKKKAVNAKGNGIQRQKQTLAKKSNKSSVKPIAKMKTQPKAKILSEHKQNKPKVEDPNIVLKQCAAYFKALNFSKALLACQKAAEQNDSNAQLNLAKMYSTGFTGSAPDYVKALQYTTLAANQNNAEAQYLLALCYENGIGVNRDSAASINWYQQAVKNGLSKGVAIQDINNTTSDTIANISWPGSSEYKSAMKSLKNPDTRSNGMEALTEAAELGHPLAEYQLAKEYLQGDNIAQDDAKAIEWFTKSAQKNYQAAQSQLAWMSFLGLGTKQSNQHSVKWFVEARQLNAHQDYDSTIREKLTEITTQSIINQSLSPKQRIAEFKRGVELIETSPQAHVEAVNMVLVAAEKDLIPAQLFLADLYANGDKVPQDLQKSTNWYLRAAANGSPEAQYAMGWHYYHGFGVTQSTELALKSFHQASLGGDVRAKNAEQFLIAQQVSPKAVPTTPTLGNRIKDKVHANVQGIFKAVGFDKLNGYNIFNKKS